MDGAGGGGVVDEQYGGHNVVVGSVRLHGARDGVVRDEVLDRVLGVKQVRVYFIFDANIIYKIYGQHPLSKLLAPYPSQSLQPSLYCHLQGRTYSFITESW
jgi:hypothetical protein